MGALPTERPARQERGHEVVTSLACSHREASLSTPLSAFLSASLDSSGGCSVSVQQSLSKGCQQVRGV